MSEDDGHDSMDSPAGTPVEDAVAELAEREDVERDVARQAIQGVAEDGVVTAESIDDALAHTAKVVSTPETRVELAGMDLDEARESAKPYTDFESVTSRLESFESRVEAIETRIDELGTEFESLVDQAGDSSDIHDVALGNYRVTSTANETQRAADDLRLDIDGFEKWLSNSQVRYRELSEDVDAVEQSLDELAQTVTALEEDDAGDTDRFGDADPSSVWFEASIRQRTLALMLDDVRFELSELQEWDDQEDRENERATEIEGRVESLAERRDSLGDKLDACARDAWRDQYGARLTEVDEVVASFDPPVDWADLQSGLDSLREPGV